MNNKKRTLIIRFTNKDLVFKMISKRGYNIEEMYRGDKWFITRSLRRIWVRFKLPFYTSWFNKKVLKYDVDTIILFDSLLTINYLKWLKKNKDVRVVIWYWNIAKNSISPDKIGDKEFEKWTFSSLDAKKHNMKFNPSFFFHELKSKNLEKEYDIIFVGKDKGRLNKLIEYENKFIKMGLKCKFIITPTKKYSKNKLYSKPITLEDSFNLSSKSKAIFDYIEINNSGQSLRMMESLFHNKKIITNNILIKDYDFYDKNNIFILEHDDLSKLKDFLNSSYYVISKDIVCKYDFDNFFNNFFDLEV